MKFEYFQNKMKFKKAGLSNILSFVLLFNLFFGLMIAMFFNSITQERRSMVIDYINKEAMTLQANLNGYSINPMYCYMYQGGSRMSYASAEAKKNREIETVKNNIKKKFQEDRYKNQMVLTSVDVEVIDDEERTTVAKVKITVKYKALFRSPFNDEEGVSSDNLKGALGVNLIDTASRAIENPIRMKNLK